MFAKTYPMLVTSVDNLLMESFGNWLQEELNKRDMSQADLSRASGLTTAGIAYLINGRRNAGEDAVNKIARALKLPPETVFRAAGLLPPVSEIDEMKAQLIELTANMSREEQREVLEYLRMKRRLREEREQEEQSLPLGAKVAKQGR